MQYQGGKSRIARELAAKIRALHPEEAEIWEPFCGGGAMTRALSIARFRVHALDAHPDLILMWRAAQAGDTQTFVDPSEAEYRDLKTQAPSARRGFVGFGASFGGGWWAGFARRRIADRAQPHEEARRSVCKIAALPGIDFGCADYHSVPDGALVYADPPYAGTKHYKGLPPFDHAAFWQWVRTRSGPTFVSELQGPDDVEVVWRKLHKSQNSSNSPTTCGTAKVIEREEKLFYKPRRS